MMMNRLKTLSVGKAYRITWQHLLGFSDFQDAQRGGASRPHILNPPCIFLVLSKKGPYAEILEDSGTISWIRYDGWEGLEEVDND